MKKILGWPDIVERLVGWAIELGDLNIEYHSRTTIKGKVVADFIVETTVSIELEGKTSLEDIPKWTLFFDGSSTKKISGAGIVLFMPAKVPLRQTYF